MNTKPKEAWAFWANMNGPWWKTPQRVTLRKDLGEGWWHKNENCDVEGMGLRERSDHSYLTFASYDKKEVEKFIRGFMAARRLMARFTSN